MYILTPSLILKRSVLRIKKIRIGKKIPCRLLTLQITEQQFAFKISFKANKEGSEDKSEDLYIDPCKDKKVKKQLTNRW